MRKLKAILENAPCRVASFYLLIFIFFVFIISPLALKAVDARAAEPVRVGIFQNKPLVYYEDGPKGLFVEILNHIAAKEDWNLEYVPCELEQCLDLLKTNKLDLMTALGKTQERNSYLAFSKEPVWTIWGTIYAQQDENVDGIFDLKDKIIGVIKGSRITAALQKMLTEFNIPVQYVAFENYDSLYKAFEAKKLNAFSVNNSYGFDQQRNIHSYKTPIVFSPFAVYFAAPRNGRYPGQLQIINRYVKELKADKHSLFYAFEKSWFGDRQAYWTGRRIGILSASFLFVAICLMAFWRYRSLVSINKELSLNIQERKQAERKLRFMKFSIDHIADTVFWIDKDGRLAYANESACRNLGYSQSELLAMSIPDLDPDFPAEKWPAHWKDLQEKGSILLKTQHRTKDRKLIPVEVVANYMAMEEMEYNCAVIRDITERIAAEEEHARMAAQLHQSQKMEAIGTLAGGIAHDFNNILTPIFGYLELAMLRTGDDEKLTRELTQVRNAAERARDMVQQILTFSRRESDELSPTQVDVIVKEVLKLVRASIPATIEIRQDIDPHCGTVLSNPTQIHQILMNLCTNAYYAMRETGGVLGVSLVPIEIATKDVINDTTLQPGPYLQLEVSDTGHGMDKKILDRIFDPYFTTKAKGEGTGMGLSVVHGIVKGIGGHVTVYSEPGKGSTFHIYLPVHKSSSARAEALYDGPPPTGSERILLVDDEEIVLNVEKEMLSGLGYQVSSFASPLEALEQFTARPGAFDLVITDMTMPKMTGDQLAREFMEIRPEIPVILCTGFSDLINEQSAKEMGIKEFVSKPVVLHSFSRSIRKVLDAIADGDAAGDGRQREERAGASLS